MLKKLKAVAIAMVIAAAAVAVVVFGMFIGTVLIFLGTVFLVSVGLLVLWLSIQEHYRGKADKKDQN
jgi:putative Mn2+ efflux pump MntP